MMRATAAGGVAQTPPAARMDKSHGLWPALLVVICVLVVFGRIASHEFLWWDDQQTIHNNPRLNPPTAAGLAWHWTHPHMGLYVPVTYTAWWLVAQVAYVNEPDPMGIRLNPWLFHAASILAHAGAAVAVMAILRALAVGMGPAIVGALLFALHPVQVETVAWTSGLKDLLGGLLALLAVWQYLLLAARDDPPTRLGALVREPRYWAAGALFLLAMLAKPGAIVAPLVAAALDVLILRRGWRMSLARLWPAVLLMVPCAALTRLVQEVGHPYHVPLWARPLVALDALAFYAWKIVAPLHLAPDYGRRPAAVIDQGWMLVTWTVPVALAVLAWLLRRRSPWLAAGGAVLVLGLLPVLGLTPFMFQYYSTVADHYLYLPMLGAALIAAGIMSQLKRPAAWTVCPIILAILGLRSMAQAGHWRDHSTIMTHALAVNPRSFMACTNLGGEQMYLGRPDRAEPWFRRALEIEPNDPKSLDNLSTILLQQGRLDEALTLIERLIPLLPQIGRAHDVSAAQQAVTALRARQATPPTAPTTRPSG